MSIARSELPKETISRASVDSSELAELKAKQLELANKSDAGAYRPHVYQVFNDPGFRTDVNELRKKLEKLYYKDISLSLDFNSKHMLGVDMDLVQQLADKYCISLDDLGSFADGAFDDGARFGSSFDEYGGLSYGPPGHWGVCYVIGDKTTLKQIADDWEMIKDFRSLIAGTSKNTKLKAPQNPELIYAIFKARNFQKLTFSQIYEQYQNGEIGGYKVKHTKQYKGKDELERYYNGAKPSTMTTPLSLPLNPR